MKTFAELENRKLRWDRKGLWESTYQLHTEDGEVIGSIAKIRGWGQRFEVDALGSHWIFISKGLRERRIIIRSAVTEEEPAEFVYRSLSSGKLQFKDGRVFIWRKTGFFKTRWVWTTEDGEPVLGFTTKSGKWFSAASEISVDVDALQKEVLLMASLGWHLILIYQRRIAAIFTAGMSGG